MSTVWKEFAGPSYQLTNRYSAVERTVNWYCLPNESKEEDKFTIELAPCPGNAPFCSLPVASPFNNPNRGLIECRGVAYGVNGPAVFSISEAGEFTNLGAVHDDGNPVSMVANGTGQIFIASGGLGYVIQPGTPPTLVEVSCDPVNGPLLGASYATFQDGYGIVVTPGTNQFQISGTDDTPIGDLRLWTPANVSIQAGQADYLQAVRSWREYLYLFGKRRSQVYYNVGNSGIGGFPFQSYNETFIETGLGAVFSLVSMGDSLMWIGEDERGQRACWRTATFQPIRTSTFAIEEAWGGYSTIADAVAFSFIWKGHLMCQITFPTANATWLYDATASQLLGKHVWSERQYTGPLGGQIARPELFHCYCYGKHLVGSGGTDNNPGAIYYYSDAAYSEPGAIGAGTYAGKPAYSQTTVPIVRDRICPHLWETNKRIIYHRIEFELLRGVALDSGVGSDPVLMLRWSNDGGYSFGTEQTVRIGKVGQYGWRAFYLRTAYARDRVFWIRVSDPVMWHITGASLDFTQCSS